MGRFKELDYSQVIAGGNTQEIRSNAVGTRHLSKVPDEAAEKICRILQDVDLAGAVISGPSGSGRRATVELGCALLPEKHQITRLNGSTFGAKIPMGVLAFLLANLELDVQASRHELVHSLGRLLCPDGVASVVLLGRPELIDEASGSLLAQLATMKKIKLIVVCELVQDLPRDILALFRSGKLGQVAVHRKNATQSRTFLETELGEQISVLAVATLQHLCDSNRGTMLKLARIWISQGQMIQKTGVWVLNTTELVNGPAMRTLFNSMTLGLNDAERVLLYALAFGGPVSMDAIHRAELTRSLDGLFSGGHVHYIQQAKNRVTITVPLLAMLLRLQIDAEMETRAQELLPTLHSDAESAQVHTKMRALVETGNIDEIIKIGEAFALTGYTAEHWALAPYLKTNVLKLHAKALVRIGEPSRAASLITEASHGLQNAMEADRSNDKLLRASQELTLLNQSIGLAGDQLANATNGTDSDTTVFRSTQWITEGLHVRALAMQALRKATQSQHDEAHKLVACVSHELQTLRFSGVYEDGLCQDELGETERMLLNCELLAGHCAQAMTRASELASGRYGNPRLVAYAETIRGILLGLQGEHERALQILEPCLRQLEQLEQGNERTAVEAVVTHALMSLGRRAEGTEMLLRSPTTEHRVMKLNFQSWVAEVFASLALALFDSVQYAQARMLAYAERVREAGHTALELHSLAFALRLGHGDSTRRLEDVAAASQGAIAASYRDLARYVFTDSAQALKAMKFLAESGYTLISTGAENALVTGLEVKDQRKLAKQVGMLKRPLPGSVQGMHSEKFESMQPTLGWARELTKRESQIAGMAISGKSNQEIARFNGVSIRTVEGHLYQVYSKLQVRNRQELTAMERASRRMVGQK